MTRSLTNFRLAPAALAVGALLLTAGCAEGAAGADDDWTPGPLDEFQARIWGFSFDPDDSPTVDEQQARIDAENRQMQELIAICMAFDKDRPKLDAKNWKAASWLPVYLIGMGIISWQGQYSGGAVLAPVNTNHLPLWIDLLVVAAFSLVIYYWAMAVKLPREEMLALVAKQSSDDPQEQIKD